MQTAFLPVELQSLQEVDEVKVKLDATVNETCLRAYQAIEPLFCCWLEARGRSSQFLGI